MAIRREKGHYVIDYYYQGKRRREVAGTNKREAENFLAKRKTEILEGKFNIKRTEKVRFSDFAATYMEHSKANKRSWDRDRTLLINLLPVFGAKTLDSITSLMIEEYKQQRLRKVKPGTVNREIALLKHLFNMAITWGMATVNPMRGVKLLREDNVPVRFLTKEEIDKLLAACTDYSRPIVLTALHTGMRRGEILGLKWDQVDFDAKIITILHSKNGRVRKIPINSVLLDVLAKLKASATQEHVFISNKTKEPIGKFQTAWLTAIRKSGIIRCRFHDLRHTFASHLVASGVDLVTVKELLGHSDINMTLRYAHSAPEQKISAVEMLVKNIGEEHSHFLVTRSKMVKLAKNITP